MLTCSRHPLLCVFLLGLFSKTNSINITFTKTSNLCCLTEVAYIDIKDVELSKCAILCDSRPDCVTLTYDSLEMVCHTVDVKNCVKDLALWIQRKDGNQDTEVVKYSHWNQGRMTLVYSGLTGTSTLLYEHGARFAGNEKVYVKNAPLDIMRTQSFTVFARIMTSVQSGYQVIVADWHYPHSFILITKGEQIRLDMNRKLYPKTGPHGTPDDNNEIMISVTACKLSDGEWHDVGFSWDFCKGEAVLYQDGEICKTSTTTYQDHRLQDNNQTFLTIGFNPTDSDGFFTGSVRHVCIGRGAHMPTKTNTCAFYSIDELERISDDVSSL